MFNMIDSYNSSVNDTIRMYKKGKIKMYKIVHDISPRVHSFVILWSEDWRGQNEEFERSNYMFENDRNKT